MATKKKSPSFEEQLTRLDVIVRQLEQGEASLEASMELFSEGTTLLKNCTQLLDKAEQKVVKLKKGVDEAPEAVPFTEEV